MIRVATIADLEAITEIIEIAARDVPGGWDLHKASGVVMGVIGRKNAYVIELEGRVAATMGLEVGDWWFSRRHFLADRWLVTHPDFRGRGCATNLIAHAKVLALYAKMILILGVSTLAEIDRKEALYQRNMQPFGGWYLFDPEAPPE